MPGSPARFFRNSHSPQTAQGISFPGTGRADGKGLQQHRFKVAQEMHRTVSAAMMQLVSVNQNAVRHTAKSRHQNQFHSGPQNSQTPDPNHGAKQEKQTHGQNPQP